MKEELRKEFVDELRKGITFAGQVGDYVINQSLFDWFYSKLEAKDKEIAETNLKFAEWLQDEGVCFHGNPLQEQTPKEWVKQFNKTK